MSNWPYILVLASRVTECYLDTQTLKNHPSGHPKIFVRNFLKCQFLFYNCLFFTSVYNSHCTYMYMMLYFIE